MKLNLEGLRDRKAWEDAGFRLQAFDIEAVRERTRANPKWLHMGASNIFRAFPAAAQQALLNAGAADTGVIACEAFDEEIVDASFAPYDNLSVAVTMKIDGFDAEVIASVTECVKASEGYRPGTGCQPGAGRARLIEIFTNPSLQMVSFTITEKGYAVSGANGLLPHIAADIDAGPARAGGLMGLTAALLLARFEGGAAPLALLSMDNCSENGEKLKNAVLTVARGWVSRGFAPEGFLAYLEPDKPGVGAAFPWSMIDKITPRPSEIVKERIEALGLAGVEIARTRKNTYVAPFVNAEETQYLIIEDAFPNGRPPLEKAGFLFTDRTTVKSVEAMKVGACLNPLHSALAVFGCILGYPSISEAMADPGLAGLVKLIGYKEALPWVPDPGILHPNDFLDTVVNVRFPNPHIPDTPQRIATDTSQKIPVRYGETLKKMQGAGADIASLTGFPFFFAGWLRYLMAVDDEGRAFELSPDPLLPELTGYLKEIKLGCADDSTVDRALRPILSNTAIFGVDLYACALAEKVEARFREFIKDRGAVRAALDALTMS